MTARPPPRPVRRGEFKMEKPEGASEEMKLSDSVGCSQVSLSESMSVG